MTYILRSKGRDVIGCWPANSSILEKAIVEMENISKTMKCDVFLDELYFGKLTEVSTYLRPKSLIPIEEQLEFRL